MEHRFCGEQSADEPRIRVHNINVERLLVGDRAVVFPLWFPSCRPELELESNIARDCEQSFDALC